MPDRPPDIAGDLLDLPSYQVEFAEQFGRAAQGFWKLERRQTFEEPDYPSFDSTVAYEVLYDPRGRLIGARRTESADVVLTWRRFIAGLFDGGEEIAAIFARRVAALPPPIIGVSGERRN
ncbi:hypothetical protein ACFP2T_15100 [Plantactinospora solaniradicis]|uniref:Uncharacterized protein n=1 Tax=Plantactinospora solaniradicis TaxID=1723736 RepID=A0ABW1KB31_9ACTN